MSHPGQQARVLRWDLTATGAAADETRSRLIPRADDVAISPSGRDALMQLITSDPIHLYESEMMAFNDTFTDLLSNHGIPVDPTGLPDEDTVKRELESVSSWFWALDPALREGYDEGSLEYAICSLLADADLGVAPSLTALFEGFDQVAGKAVSELIPIAQECAAAASSGNV